MQCATCVTDTSLSLVYTYIYLFFAQTKVPYKHATPEAHFPEIAIACFHVLQTHFETQKGSAHAASTEQNTWKCLAAAMASSVCVQSGRTLIACSLQYFWRVRYCWCTPTQAERSSKKKNEKASTIIARGQGGRQKSWARQRKKTDDERGRAMGQKLLRPTGCLLINRGMTKALGWKGRDGSNGNQGMGA